MSENQQKQQITDFDPWRIQIIKWLDIEHRTVGYEMYMETNGTKINLNEDTIRNNWTKLKKI